MQNSGVQNSGHCKSVRSGHSCSAEVIVHKINRLFEILAPKYALEQVEFVITCAEIVTPDFGGGLK